MKRRSLLVIEDKKTKERFLWNPLQKGQPVVPEGYYKLTRQIPLNEEKFGHYPVKDKSSLPVYQRCKRCNGWGDDGSGDKSCLDCDCTGFKSIWRGGMSGEG